MYNTIQYFIHNSQLILSYIQIIINKLNFYVYGKKKIIKAKYREVFRND